MMNCQQATRLMSEAQERPLSFKEQAELKVHTLICSGCRQFGEQMQLLRRFSKASRPQNKDNSKR
ncbi:zf-HC2 domain-containing protein [Thalassolituus hydrocarboniclasticus]|uniref:Zf-HC2 domain-containing protein n=2 Tax=Thalassolituus hydrocarboniclasticus TaxID=2742796 RepID=A0ABY6A5D1_9GAMM|nr:zf-HC2 domain-containing protein [Thalassolituus hydrocarboniclasticus]